MRTIERAALAAALVVCSCSGDRATPARAQDSAAGVSLFAEASDRQWRLPERLREISGLAVSPDGRLFGHDDETAVIYEIDAERGELVKAFALGDPVERGDFEGLAIAPSGEFWLTTSQGRLYRFRQGADGAHVAYQRFDPGLADTCEIEGLAYLAAEESLILACKRNHVREMRDTVSLYAWPIGAAAAAPWRTAPEAEIAHAAGVERFRPSAVEIDAASGRIILLSATDNAMAELAADGALLAARELVGEHPQPEGAAIMPDGALVIADEGGDARAALTRYPRAQP